MEELSWVRKPMSDYFVWPNRSLKEYLVRQRYGNDRVVETPFFKGEELLTICERWLTELRRGLSNTWPTLLAYEIDMLGKAGPMSVQKPLSERLADIEAYYSNVTSEVEFPREVVTELGKLWHGMKGTQPRSLKRAIEDTKMSTNSGSPYFTKRKWAIDRLLPFSIQYAGGSDWYLTAPEGKWKLTAVLGWRGQEGGPSSDDVKQRVLWMFPMAANLMEFKVYQPLILGAQKHGYVPGWMGNPEVDKHITRMFETKNSHDLIVCTDFTKYDQHFNIGCQKSSEAIIRELFAPSDELDEWFQNIYPIKYGIPMCYDIGKFAYGWHGMGSGSGGTTDDETITHKGFQVGSAMQEGQLRNLQSLCLGDDGIVTYPGVTADKLMKWYTAFGMVMNPTKQNESDRDCIYLRRWHHRDYKVEGVNVGVYPTIRALTHLRMMERYIDPDKWGVKAVAMRQLSVINNCEYHPLGEDFVKFCMKGDRYRLGLDIPGFLDNLDAEYQRAKADGTLYISYSAEFGDPRPPSQWWITSVLRKLA